MRETTHFGRFQSARRLLCQRSLLPAQFAIDGQYGIEFLLQIIGAFLTFTQIEFKAFFFVKAMTLSQRQQAFQFIYSLDIGHRTRGYRWRLGTFDRRWWY